MKEAARVEKLTLEKSFLASRIPSVMKRRADLKTAEDMRRISNEFKDPSRVIQKISVLLKENETTNSIRIDLKPVEHNALQSGNESRKLLICLLEPWQST